MKNNYLGHLGVLVIGVSVLAFFFNYFSYNTPAQIIISAMGCIYYVIWGILHHVARERISTLIVLEYVLVGTFIFLLLFTSLTV